MVKKKKIKNFTDGVQHFYSPVVKGKNTLKYIMLHVKFCGHYSINPISARSEGVFPCTGGRGHKVPAPSQMSSEGRKKNE